MKPTKRFNRIFDYLIALALGKFKMKAVVTTAMSNHYHGLMVDVEGRSSDFYHWFHMELAKATNQKRKRSGAMWENEKTSGVEVLDPEKALETAAYILMNPTRAGLVSEGRLWPGHRSSPRAVLSGPRVITRPNEKYFSSGKKPETVTVTYHVPPGYDPDKPEVWVRDLEAKVAAQELEVQQEMKAQGRKFLGASAVRRQSWDSQPKTQEPRGPGKKINPRFASSCKELRRGAIEAYRLFLVDYAEARAAYIAGDHEVLFPYGTYKLRREFNVRCHSPP